METYIALLRAVNAGGFNSLPMKEFVALLEKLGLRNIKTYIQTGNAVFQTEAAKAAQLSEKVKDAIKQRFGFAPEVILLSLAELETAVTANPFPEADKNHKSLHLTFLASKPEAPDLETLEALKKDSERFALENRVFYFYAPEGVGRSKLFARIEKLLGVHGTVRNWRTAQTMLNLAKQIAAIENSR
jgi:uncharacterized protein (DUF1697 family)